MSKPLLLAACFQPNGSTGSMLRVYPAMTVRACNGFLE